MPTRMQAQNAKKFGRAIKSSGRIRSSLITDCRITNSTGKSKAGTWQSGSAFHVIIRAIRVIRGVLVRKKRPGFESVFGNMGCCESLPVLPDLSAPMGQAHRGRFADTAPAFQLNSSPRKCKGFRSATAFRASSQFDRPGPTSAFRIHRAALALASPVSVERRAPDNGRGKSTKMSVFVCAATRAMIPP